MNPALSGFKLFRGLSPEALRSFEDFAEPVSLATGDTLVARGHATSDIFVLLEGEMVLRERVGSSVVDAGRVLPGGVIGELQLLMGDEHAVNVEARKPSRALKLSRTSLESLGEVHPELRARLIDGLRERLRLDLFGVILRTRMRLDEEVIAAVMADAEWITLERGDVLVRQGDPSDAMYVLIQGRLEAVVTLDGLKIDGKDMLPGESVGETAVLDAERRAATVTAVRPSEVAKLSNAKARALSARFSNFSLRILEIVVARQNRANDTRRRIGGGVIAVVPVTPGVPIERVMAEIRRTMPGSGVERIDRQRVDAQFGAGAADSEGQSTAGLRVRLWLEHLDARTEALLLQGDRPESRWTRRCVATADEVVLVGMASSTPAPSPAEQALRAISPSRTTLVLLHHGDGAAQGTAAWLQARNVDQVHHVGLSNQRDFDRLGRFLLGRAVGVVLSGGAARAFAGIGVLKAMEELGIPVDAVGGVSAGALVAAAYAHTRSADQLGDWMARFARTALPDPTLPLVSVFRARTFIKAIRQSLGERGIEDLALPCLFVSSNLTRARQHVSRRGRVDEHLYASNALPPLMPPMVIDGDLHVDGGLANNTPIAEVKELVRGGPVIALDVTPRIEFEHNAATPDGVSGWQVARDRLRRRGPYAATPTMFDLLLRAQLLHHAEQLRNVQRLAAVYLAPDLRKFRFSDYLKHRAIAEAGREASKAQLQEFWQAQRRPT